MKDFDYYVFSKQFRFYKKVKWHEHKAIGILIKFYIFLYSQLERKQIQHEIFTTEDGIDKYYLYKDNFDQYYSAGFRLVNLNSFDKIPESDRWMINPNGYEEKSISWKEHDYKPFNFTQVRCEKLKFLLKKWVWEEDISIYSKHKTFFVLVDFINFITDLQEEENNVIDVGLPKNKSMNEINMVSVDHIIEYRIYLQKFENKYTKNIYIVGVKKFLDFLYDNNLIDIEYIAFNYLKRYDINEDNGNPITKGDLQKIVKEYKRLANDRGVKEKLQLIILNLCVTTNLRYSEVINLKTDCLSETMKQGEFAISFNKASPVLSLHRKTSNGKSEENISKYTYRLINNAIEITEDLREKADKSLKDYIFLFESNNKIVKPFSKGKVRDYFNKVTNALELDDYTVYNLRDTFITNVIHQGKNQGESLNTLSEATGIGLETASKHYKGFRIKDYLEAFYKVKISDVDIQGNITKNLNDEAIEYSKMVKEGCGYCARSRGCVHEKYIDCFLCKHFVVTVDKAPYFKSKIADLDEKIKKEDLSHEQEHLIAIKKLMVKYLEKIYELKLEEEG